MSFIRLRNIYFYKTTACFLGLIIIFWFFPSRSADWKEVQKLKLGYITEVARHVIEQQKRSAMLEVSIIFPENIIDSPKMKVISKSSKALRIKLTDVHTEDGQPMKDVIRFKLAQPMNMLDRGSGISIIVETEPNSSREIRLGMRFIGDGGKKTADILPYIPIVSNWGDNSYEIYFDWSFINYRNVRDAIEVLKRVEAIEFLAGSILRAPERGASRIPQSATITISNIKLVDYLKGSYDPARHSWQPNIEPDLTLQHRCQEVTGIVAIYGGKEGIQSAIESLDLCVRTQCWDGSFLDGRRGARTVTSGEYTHGFAIYGLLTGYIALEGKKVTQLDEKITVGTDAMTRRDFYQRMFYRAGMSRAGVTTPSNYRDDIIGGNTLITGANRVLGYAIGMRMVADILRDGGKKKELLSKFDEIMSEILDAQGKFSGGFPILAEGDRFKGAGIHYDNSYVRTHMDWLVIAVQRTGDLRFVDMLRRYQDVFKAVMDSEGKGLVPLLSERGSSDRRSNVQLVIPDATAQVGIRYNLPIIAQWGYNCGMAEWIDWNEKKGNFWTDMSRIRGYRLGAHSARLLDDFNPELEPRDIGYLFPRQFPIWSTKLFNKNKELVKTSHVYIKQDGTMENDFKIDIGLYPETVGVPVSVKSPEGTVIATALELSGWPKLLPENADLTVSVNGEVKGKIMPDEPFEIMIANKAEIIITGPIIQLPPEASNEKISFKVVFSLELLEKQKQLPVTIVLHRGTVLYVHKFKE